MTTITEAPPTARDHLIRGYSGQQFHVTAATFRAMQAHLPLDTRTSGQDLISTAMELLDQLLNTGEILPPPVLMIECSKVVEKMREGKQRYAWCGSAERCIEGMGLRIGKEYTPNDTIAIKRVKTMAQRYGNHHSCRTQVDDLLTELGISV